MTNVNMDTKKGISNGDFYRLQFHWKEISIWSERIEIGINMLSGLVNDIDYMVCENWKKGHTLPAKKFKTYLEKYAIDIKWKANTTTIPCKIKDCW